MAGTVHVVSFALTGDGWLALIFVMLGIGLVVSGVKEFDARLRKKKGLPPRPPRAPRQPMDVSPFTASLLSGQSERSYYPRGITATTPSGVRVSVRCPHRSGHRSPDLAIQCGEREKARIETHGR
jgi:hypothetical protein